MTNLERADFNEQCRQYWLRLIASRSWCATGLSTRRPTRQNHLRVDLPDDRVWILVYRDMPTQRLATLGALVKFDRASGVALWEQLQTASPSLQPLESRWTTGRDPARESRNLVISAKVNDSFAPSEDGQFDWFAEKALLLRRYMATVLGDR